MIKDKCLVQVDPKFKKLLKVESALKGISICNFTKQIANNDDFISEYFKKKRY